MPFSLKFYTKKLALVVLLALFAFKSVNADEIITKSSFTLKFKGKTYHIPYIVTNAKVKSMYAQSWSTVVSIDSKQRKISFVGLSALSKELNVDFGGVKQGEQIGDYNFQIIESTAKSFYFGIYMPSRPNAQETYFATQQFSPKAQNGVFFDLAKGGKRWEIMAENSTITVTKSDPGKLEGTFSLALKFGDQIEKATGVFDIYK